MDPREILKLVHKQPFEAFSIRLHDGRVFDVTHPEVIVPGKRSIYIGFFGADRSGLVDDWVMISPVAIVSVQPTAA